MSENIHNEDEYFKRAYQRSEEEPSPEVWNKINAELDKQEAVYYRKKFTAWRLIACFILFLSGSIAVYYTFFRTEGTGVTINKSKVNNPQAADSQTSLADSKKDATSKHPDSINTNSLNNEKVPIINSKPLHNNENQSDSYNPQTVAKNRKQDTPQPDNTSVTEQGHKQQVKPQELISDSEKQLQQHMAPSLSAWNKEYPKQTITDKQPANSITNSTLSNKSSNELPKEIITENVKPQTATQQDNVVIKQDNAFRKPVTYKRDKTSSTPYWTFTPFVSADLTHYKLDNDALETNNSNEPEDKGDIQEREKHEFSYSAGLMAKLQFNRKLGVKTGVIYSNIAIGIQPQTLYASANGSRGVAYKYITSSGYAYVNLNSGIEPVPGDSISSYIAQHHLQYLSIPALFSYTMLNKKHFSLDAAAGISTNLLLSTTVETELDDDNSKKFVAIHKLQGLRPLYFSYVVDANMQFYMNKHINFTLIPSFRYAIDPINKNNVVKTYPYSFGLGAGLTYRL